MKRVQSTGDKKSKQSISRERLPKDLRSPIRAAVDSVFENKPHFETLEDRRMLSVSAGNLDNSFGTGGLSTTTGSERIGQAVAVEPASQATAGDVIVAGSDNGQFAISVYSPAGAEIAHVATAVGTGTSQANAVTIDASGRILAAGFADEPGTQDDFVVARYNWDGTTLALDTSFGGSGYVATDVGGSKADVANSITIDPALGGDILLAGTTAVGTATPHTAVVAYTSSGTVDTTNFGSGTGKFVVTSGASDAGNGIAVDASGNIAVAGQSPVTGTVKAELILINSAGTSGTRYAPNLGSAADANAITVASNGDFLLAGTADNNLVVAAIVPSGINVGKLDPTFNAAGATPGEIEFAFSGNGAQGNSIAVQANQRIVVGGAALDGSSDSEFALVRLNADGTPDAAFGTGGAVTGTVINSAIASTAVESDGRIVVAGTVTGVNDSLVAGRYVADNAPLVTSNASLDNIAQNQTNSAGNTVATIVSRINETDVDGDAVGIAITAVDNSHGTWQYSTNGGTSFTAIGAVSSTSALLLAQTTGANNNVIRFVPAIGYSGAAALTLRGWDQTQGTNNGTFNTVTSASSNLNAFSDSAFTLTQNIAAAANTVYVNAAWAGSSQNQSVSDAHGAHTFGIDAFATIQDGVTYVASSGTVDVDAGLYTENVTVNKPVTLDGAYAGTSGASATGASPTRSGAESVVRTNGNQNAVFTIASNGVTIDGFDIEGDDPSLDGTSLTSGDDSNATYGIRAATSFSSLHLQNNIIKDVQIGFRGDASTTTAPTGDTISQNWFDSVGIYDFGYAVTLRSDFYADVTDNLMTRVQTGVHLNNFSAAVGPATWLIQDNTISAYGGGIWDNLQYNNATSATIDHNTISSLSAPVTGANRLVRSNFDNQTIGILLVSLQDHVTANVTNNDISGMAYGVTAFNDTTANIVSIGGTNNIHDNTVAGVYVTNKVDANPISRTELGGDPSNIPLGFSGPNNPNGLSTVNLSGITLANNATGVLVRDANSFTSFGAAVTVGSGVAITGGTTGLEVDGARAAVTGNTLGDLALSGQSGDYVTLANGALGGASPTQLNATNATFGGLGGGNATSLSQFYAIENKISDNLDGPAVGYVELDPTNVYVAQQSDTTTAGAIQRGVNNAPINGVVNVQAGTYIGANTVDATDGYVSAVNINKALTLRGPNATFDPNTNATPANAQAILLPGLSNPTTNSTESVGIDVTASNVTIEGITINGSNPSLTHAGGLSYRGVPLDAAEGIVSSRGVGNIKVQGNLLENFSDIGVDFYNYDNGGTATSDNLITRNLIQHVSDDNLGDGILIYNNFYAQITNNLISDVYVAVQTGNFSNANSDGGFAPEISNNAMVVRHDGMFFNLHYANASAFSLDGNTITAIAPPVGGLTPNSWNGIVLASQQSAVNVSLSNNSIDGTGAVFANTSAGYVLWNDPTTGSVAISGGTVSAVQYGVWANSYEGYASNGGAVSGSVTNVHLNASQAGVYVEDSAANSTHPAVSLTVTGSTMTGAATGILISGSNASATATGNTFTNNTTGISDSGGKITVGAGNAISGGTTGLAVSGATASIVGDTLNDLSFSGQSGDYITLSSAAEGGHTITATSVNFDGHTGATASSAQAFAIENKITDAIDDSTLGFVRIKTNTLFVTPGGSIQAAVNAAAPGDTIEVAPGTYTENVTVNKSVTLEGAYANTSGSAASGSTPTRTAANETVVRTNGNQGAVFTITASGVTINGFDIEGDDPSLTNISLTSSEDSNATYGIRIATAQKNLNLENNIIRDVQIGVRGDGSAANAASGNVITQNWFDSDGIYDFGYAVSLRSNFYANVTDNLMTRVQEGVHLSNFSGTGGPASWSVSDNTISAYGGGIWDNLQFNNASPLTIDGNTINTLAAPITSANALVRSNFDNQTIGILIVSVQDHVSTTVTNNTISGMAYGVTLFNDWTSNTITLGSTNNIHDNTLAGVYVTNKVDNNPISRTELGGDPSNIPPGFTGPNNPNGVTSANLTGITLANNGTGVLVRDGNTFSSYGVAVSFGSGDSITGGTTGVTVDGPRAIVTGNTLNDLSLSGQSGNYVTLANGALGGTTPTQVDATNSTFDGHGGGNPTTVAQFDAIENKVSDYLDTPSVGYLKLDAANVYVTAASEATTSNAIQRGVNVAPLAGTVNVQAGNYVGQVSITQDLTLTGAGQGVTTIKSPATLATSFLSPSVNKAVVFAGHANVNVNNLTIDGDHKGTANNRMIGLGYYDASGTIDHVTVTGVTDTNFSGVQAGNAIYAFNDAGTNAITISNNTVSDYQKNGITANGVGLTATITDNTVTGQNQYAVNAQNGIQIGFGAGGTVSGNIISNQKWNNTTDPEAAGVLLYQTAPGTSVHDNTITGSDVGVSTVDASGVVFNNAVTGAVVGIEVDGGSLNIHDNSLTGGVDGIDLFDSQNGATIQNNLIQNNSGIGVSIDSSVTDTSTLHVNNNAISNNATAGLDNSSTLSVDATNNWWGSANGPTAAGNTFNVGSQGDKITGSGSTTYVPWLNSGHNNATGAGFIPDAGASYAPVTDDAGGKFASIQAAVNSADGSHNITADAGTFTENVNVSRNVNIAGAGSSPAGTVVTSSGNVLTIAASGADSAHPLTISGIAVQGGTRGVELNGTLAHLLLSDVAVTGTANYGIEVDNSAVLSDLNLTNVSVSTNTTNGVGFNVATTGGVNGLTITGSHFDNNAYGLETQNSTSSHNNETRFTNISVSNSTFNNDTFKGMYFETLDHATFTNVTVNNSGTGATAPAGVDINLKYGTYASIAFNNATFTNDGTGAAGGAGLTIKGRNDAPSYNTNTASLTGVTLNGVTISGSPIDLAIGNNVTGVTMSGVALNGTGVGLQNFVTAPGTLNLVDTTFDAGLATYIANQSANGITATGATFGAVTPADNTLADLYAVEDKIVDAIDVSGLGLVRLRTGNIYVTQNSYFAPTTTAPSIQRGVNVAVSGDTVNVQAGTYDEDVTISTNNLSLKGAGAASTTISGAIGGASASTINVAASNADISGFTITRDGNNTTDWNNPGLNSVGIALSNPGLTGTTIHDNIITGNRTGIDVNNTSGHTIRNNVITDNRTGLIFRNQTDNLVVTENFITNNWTDGVLFLDASGGSNSPVQTAHNSHFFDNDISGNWYGQVVDRQAGGSLPAPGTTNTKDFSQNWFGSATPVVTTADSTEPGYAAQIPVEFGGTATAPGGQPDIAGPASANILTTPLLASGTDTNVETTAGRGTFGFQGDLSQLAVTISGAATVDEGATYTLNLNPQDPGSPNITGWDIDWNDGSGIQHINGDPTTATHTYSDGPNNYSITATATTSTGTANSNAVAVSVINIDPTIAISGASSATEGGSYTLNLGAVTDPGQDSVTSYIVHWGDGHSDTYGSNGAKSHSYADGPNGYSITVDLVDEDGTYTNVANPLSVTINNVNPTVAIAGSSTASEGGTYSLTLTSSDAGDDTVSSWVIDWGDGSSPQTITAAPRTGTGPFLTSTIATHVFAAGPNNYTITAKAFDEDSPVVGYATNSVAVAVGDVAPTVALSGSKSDSSNPTANDAEGSTFTLTLAPVNDPGYAGGDRVQSYFINWGDNSPVQQVTAAQLDQLTGGTVTHTYADGTVIPGTTTPTHTIHVDILDNNGYHSDAGTLGIVVYNLPPTASFSGSGSVSEGTSGSVVFFGQGDPSSVDASSPFTYSYDFNNDGIFEVAGSTQASVSVPASFLASPGTVTVRGRIIDKDGGFTDYTHDITVNNVNPSVNALSNVTIGAGTAFTQAGSFTDPGADSPWQVYVNYNYDPITNPGQGTLLQTSPSKNFNLSNTYNTPGTYTVLVTVVDSHGGTGTGTFTVNAQATGFAVTNFTPTPSGFDVTFNRALNTSALNLYKGLSNTYGTSDLTLTGPSGEVHGSFVYDPATFTGHFIATGGVLPVGSYSASLVGSTSAFQDNSGNPLTSNDNTSNYDASFTITTINDVVSLPDFARGPGQAVNLPVAAGNGVPISISEGSNVTSVDFILHYNPSLMNISAVNLAAGLPSGWGVTSDVASPTIPGQLHITVSGPANSPLSAGVHTLVYLVATVPTAATYGASNALTLTSLRINEGAIAGTADAAVDKVAFLGDVTGNRGYSATDASYISNVVATNSTGFDAYPLVDPVIVGDVTADGTLSGQDASVMLQASLTPVPQLPAIPGDNVTTLPQTGLDPTVSIPSSILANPGGTVIVPINISDFTGLQGANFTITYDPSLLTFNAADPNSATLGSLDAAGWSILASNQTAGTITIALSDNGVNNGSGAGSIANLKFTVNSSAATGSTPVTIAPLDGGLNEGALPMTPVNGSVNIQPVTIGSANVFYYGSSWDSFDTAPNITNDYAAVASDKTALLPGQTASFANYTSYLRGLNGLLVDFSNLASGTSLSVSDFVFQTSSTGAAGSWVNAASPLQILMGTHNGDTVADIVWADNAIQNTWLQVTVLNNTFYFGNLIGSTGLPGSVQSNIAKITTVDVTATQQQRGPLPVLISNAYDFDRDGKVTTIDVTLVQNKRSPVTGLTLFTAPGSSAATVESSQAVAPATQVSAPPVFAVALPPQPSVNDAPVTGVATTFVTATPVATVAPVLTETQVVAETPVSTVKPAASILAPVTATKASTTPTVASTATTEVPPVVSKPASKTSAPVAKTTNSSKTTKAVTTASKPVPKPTASTLVPALFSSQKISDAQHSSSETYQKAAEILSAAKSGKKK